MGPSYRAAVLVNSKALMTDILSAHSRKTYPHRVLPGTPSKDERGTESAQHHSRRILRGCQQHQTNQRAGCKDWSEVDLLSYAASCTR